MAKALFHCFIHIIVLLFPEDSHADQTLKKLLPNVNFFERAPKNWHQYIRDFLHVHLKKETQNYLNMQNILKLFQHTSNVFKKNIEKYSVILKPVPIFTLIKSIAEKFCEQTHGALKVGRRRRTWGWIINTNPLLRSNLTYFVIYINEYNNGCKTDSLAIVNSHDNETLNFFCGFNPTFVYHSKFSAISIEVNHLRLSPVFILFTFIVMDGKVLESAPTSGGPLYSDTWKPLVLYHLKNTLVIALFYIQVDQLSKIIICTLKPFDRYLIYDGPNIKSDILKMDRNKTITSTFQCVVAIFSQKNFTAFFTSRKVKQFDLVMHLNQQNTSFIQFPNTDCLGQICYILLHARKDTVVNISVTGLTIDINNADLFDPKCLYYGLLINHTTSHQNFPVCDCTSFNNICGQFFSHTSSVVLIFYYYKHYKVMHKTLLVSFSQTKCRPIEINMCTYTTMCLGQSIFSNCKRYLDKLDEPSFISFSKSEKTLVYSLKQNKCVIFEFSSVARNATKIMKCHLQLKPGTANDQILHVYAHNVAFGDVNKLNFQILSPKETKRNFVEATERILPEMKFVGYYESQVREIKLAGKFLSEMYSTLVASEKHRIYVAFEKSNAFDHAKSFTNKLKAPFDYVRRLFSIMSPSSYQSSAVIFIRLTDFPREFLNLDDFTLNMVVVYNYVTDVLSYKLEWLVVWNDVLPRLSWGDKYSGKLH